MILPLLAIALYAAPRPASEVTELERLRPGATAESLAPAIGEPFVTEPREAYVVRHYRAADAGLADATAWCDEKEVVRFARVHLVNELAPSTARLLFDLVGAKEVTEGHAFATTEDPVGTTVHYSADGVHFFVVGDVVRELWRTEPGADPAEIRAAAGERWPPVLPEDRTSKEEPEEGEGTSVVTLEELFGEDVLERAGEGELDVSGMGRPPVGFEEPAPPFETTPPPALSALLFVGPVTTAVTDSPLGIAARLQGSIRAVGVQGETLQVFGYLFAADGRRPILAARGAPAELRDPRGTLRAAVQDTVLYPDSSWNEQVLFLPLQHALGFERMRGKHVLSLEVYCGGKAAYCSGEVTLAPATERMPRPDRQVWLGGAPRVEETTLEGVGPGFTVLVPLEVRACRGLRLAGQVTLRTPSGEPVGTAPGAEAWRDPQGSFYSLSVVEVAYDSSSWEAFRLFVPYAALALPAGERKLCVRFAVHCENIGAALEFDHTFVKP